MNGALIGMVQIITVFVLVRILRKTTPRDLRAVRVSFVVAVGSKETSLAVPLHVNLSIRCTANSLAILAPTD